MPAKEPRIIRDYEDPRDDPWLSTVKAVGDAVVAAREEKELLEWVREHGGARRALDILQNGERKPL